MQPDVQHTLIISAKAGDLSAQKQLFEQYFAYVTSLCLRYMSSREEAEEVVNDTFLKFFARLDQYDSAFPLKAWLRKMAINTCIDRLRRLKNRPSLLEWTTAFENSEDHSPLELDDEVQILPLIQALPPRYRAVFNLYVFEEYKHQEIAKLLGISEGTSKSNYARAKTSLRKSLIQRTRIDRKGKIQWAIKSLLF